MRKLELSLRDLIVIGASALALVSCGRTSTSSEDEVKTINNQTPVVAQPTPTPYPWNPTNPSATPTPTPMPGNTSCPQYPSRGYYEYYVSGSGQNTATTTSNDIVADHKLRISIEPKASGVNANPNTGGTMSYSKMALKVTLLRNGVAVATQNLPNPSTYSDALNDGTSGYTLSIPIDQKSNPSMLDFSNSVYGSGRYSVRIENVKTDTTCKNQCRPNSGTYAGHCVGYWEQAAQNCQYYRNAGFTWTTDYTTGYLYCCDGPQLQECNKLQCGVGPSNSGQNWNVYVRVETDSTSCIQ